MDTMAGMASRKQSLRYGHAGYPPRRRDWPLALARLLFP